MSKKLNFALLIQLLIMNDRHYTLCMCKYLSYLRSYRTNTNIDPKTTNIVLTLIQKILALIII